MKMLKADVINTHGIIIQEYVGADYSPYVKINGDISDSEYAMMMRMAHNMSILIGTNVNVLLIENYRNTALIMIELTIEV